MTSFVVPAPASYNVDDQARKRLYERELLRRGLPLPPTVRTQSAAEEMARRGLLKYKTFESFVLARNPTLLRFEHVRKALPVIERVVRGELRNVLVLWPTQYHKSELWSRLLPAYYLLQHPMRTVALASYGADLAWELSGDARDYYASAGGKFREGSPRGSTRNWRTEQQGSMRGGMWATGIGGPALGRGYNLGIVDDPIDPEQVTRAAYQRRFARWWPAKWLRGQRPGASTKVVVMQRLDPSDPIEWLFERELHPRLSEKWHVIAFDEVHSEEPYWRSTGPQGLPPSCTLEPDSRPVGAVLAPTWRSEVEVLDLQSRSGPIVTAAQRQLRPMRPTGDFWQLKWFEDRVYDDLPKDAYNGGWDWDTAYGEDAEKHSATAGIKSFRGVGVPDAFRIYIDDVRWDWLDFPKLVKWLLDALPPHYVEKKASGKSVAQVLRAYKVNVEEVGVLGDKLARAAAAQPAVNAGRVYIARRVWDKLLYGEQQGLLRVTAEALSAGARSLDVNDAFVQAVHRHLGLGALKRKAVRVV
jgi:phage terminase large subunit-like protein